MTSKEKAQKLVDIYLLKGYGVIHESFAKQCALITVDEMIKMYNEMNENGFLKPNSVGFILNDLKTEIEKL